MTILKEWKTLNEKHDIYSTKSEYSLFLKENREGMLTLFNEITYPEINAANDNVINARGLSGKSDPSDQEIKNPTRNGIIGLTLDAKTRTAMFVVPGGDWPKSKEKYSVVVQFSKQGPTAKELAVLPPAERLKALDVKVSCNCPFFRWNGPEYQAKVGGYLLTPQQGTASEPNVRDPEKKYYICKHIVAAFEVIDRKFRLPRTWYAAAEGKIAPVAAEPEKEEK